MKSTADSALYSEQIDAERQTQTNHPIVLKNDSFDRFIHDCQTNDAPNEKLKDALNYARNKGF